MTDARDHRYCCMGCHWQGTFMQLIGADTVRCPKCMSDHLEFANGTAVEADWQGEKPSVLQ